ncbi:lasso peptide biosynthesis B2 protein [Mucilaginibacter sp.]|uniref:lasso peptide biosynthesis B2 protein n=1 Tax=Mucilaginibacter sp. TaxID=1882438 RepID=UPI002CCFFFEF|nr:lasso peptide biosynthesis B2 protein [Mucilaginibacter sp.]HTI60183.1 lasso peptide biosynthesis B2 protein [Mucilaginibacter sp.]
MKIKWPNIPPRSLSYADKWIFFRTLMLAFLVRVLVKITGFKHTVRFLRRFEKGGEIDTDIEIAELKKYRFMITLSHKFWPATNCLSSSLAFWLTLRRKGIKTDLKFGILTVPENKLKSHAWLEHKGYLLSADDSAIGKFKTFDKPVL